MRHQLTASPIEAHTKGEVKRLRESGYVPVSVQHKGDKTMHLMEEIRPLQDFISHHGQSTLIDLVVAPGNKRHTVMVHDVQRDPLSQKLIHVTYQEISSTDEIHTHVSLFIHGEPLPVKHGSAIAQHPLETIEIRCDQKSLPDRFDVDVSQMELGDVMRVSDIKHDANVKITTPADTVIYSLKSITVSSESEGETVEPVAPAVAPADEA